MEPSVVDAREALYARVWELSVATMTVGLQDTVLLSRAMIRVVTASRRYATALVGTGEDICPQCFTPVAADNCCCPICEQQT